MKELVFSDERLVLGFSASALRCGSGVGLLVRERRVGLYVFAAMIVLRCGRFVAFALEMRYTDDEFHYPIRFMVRGLSSLGENCASLWALCGFCFGDETYCR